MSWQIRDVYIWYVYNENFVFFRVCSMFYKVTFCRFRCCIFCIPSFAGTESIYILEIIQNVHIIVV